jgi:alpha-beta hydrolase superfamily lysophospholipase
VPSGAYAAGMPSIVSRATTTDGTDLLVRHWLHDEEVAGGAWAGRPWAYVLLVHGLSDHSGRYEHVGEQLAAAGLDTWSFDLRGNGGSSGRRGHVDRWRQLHDDLAERLRAVRELAGDRPVVLYGHSMGTLIVLGYLLSDRPKPDLVVAGSPALDSTLPGWKKMLARVLGRIAPTIPIPTGIDGRTLSRDPMVGERAAADPLTCRVSTARFGAEGLAEQERVGRNYRDLPPIPMLVLHGLDDGLVPSSASEILGTLPNAERHTYPGLRHELHNELEGPRILDEVIAWLRQRATIAPQPNTASGERLAR